MYKLGYNTGGKYGYCNNKFITKNAKQIFLITTIVFSIGFFIIPMQEAVAGVPSPTIDWEFPSYPIDSGFIPGPTAPITFDISDPSLVGNGIDSIDVVLTSSTGDSTTLTLTETVDNGMFTSSVLIFTHGPAEYSVTDTLTITIEDDCEVIPKGNCDPDSVDFLIAGDDGAVVQSTTHMGGIQIGLTETGADTDIFTRVVKFSTVGPSDADTATIHVSPGDIITIADDFSGAKTNALIIPSSADSGSIPAVVGGIVTASYGGVSADVSVSDDGAGGRGSGGLLRPGLVLNFAASISPSSSSCSGDCTNPTLGLDANNNRIVDKGFSYNGFAEDVMDFYTPYPLITTNVGQENVAVLKIYENGGPENIKHVSLAFGLSHGGESISQSKAIIKWDRTFFGFETVTVEDPENALQDISVESTTGLCSANSETQCLILKIYHTFREYLGFNIVGTDVWDSKLNSETNFYNDGVKVIGESMNPPKQFRVQDSRGYPAVVTQTDKDKGMDEQGNAWTLINNIWSKDYAPPEIISDTVNSHGVDRNNNMFKTYVDGQNLLAQELLHQKMFGKIIQNPDFDRRDNYVYLSSNFDIYEFEKQLQKQILNEQTRAEELFCTLYDIKPQC